ncbi:MAG: N-acetylmuramoyl-L-alanine amidase [Kiritimatiellaeota bacterium]|nr:N-acetylmuramoyl-L-alanine amidase [Kiritimatiellota bacterium]
MKIVCAVVLLLALDGCLGGGAKKKNAPEWLGARDVMKTLNAKKPRRDGERFAFRLPKGGDVMFFLTETRDARGRPVIVNSRRVEVNGVLLWLNAAPVGVPGASNWRVLRADLENLRAICVPAAPPANRLVMLDPGHGGNDPGASANGLVEKNVTLEIALMVREVLGARGVRVEMTREADATLTRPDRSLRAGHEKAGLFVSLHMNHAANAASFGVETFTLTAPGQPNTAAGDTVADARPGNAFDPENNRLGFALQSRLVLLSDDRGLKRARYIVLSNAPCPAALVECGFLSNPGEADLMRTSEHREKTARAIADAIMEFMK